jgi:hypothetical protein
MTYFTSRDLIAVAACAASWAILNTLIAPIFWQLTYMPFFCDLLAFLSLTLAVWWTRKFGAATLTGLIVAALTLMLRPTAFHIFAFAAASFLFDLLTRAVGYRNCLERRWSSVLCIVLFSMLSAAVAGAIIGSLFMSFMTLEAILTFAGLHSIGGVIGGALGVATVRGLIARGVVLTDWRKM